MMRITIKEAMQLKNEVAAALRGDTPLPFLAERTDPSTYGELTINGEKQDVPGGARTFPEQYAREEKLLTISEKLHSALAQANVQEGIGDAIRERENVKRLIALNERALRHSKAYTKTETRNIAGTGLERVEIAFRPYATSADLKGRIRALKRSLRALQTHIDMANLRYIEIPNLTFETIEALLD